MNKKKGFSTASQILALCVADPCSIPGTPQGSMSLSKVNRSTEAEVSLGATKCGTETTKKNFFLQDNPANIRRVKIKYGYLTY